MKTNIFLSIFYLFLSIAVSAQQNAVIDSLEDVLKIANTDTGKVNCLNTLSSEYWKIRDYSMSLQYAEFALELAESLSHLSGIATAYQNIGFAYEKQAKLPVALKNHLAALNILKELRDNIGMSYAYKYIAWIHKKEARYAEALECFSASLKISEEAGDKFGIGSTHFEIGKVCLQQGKYEEAIENYSTALEISKELGNKHTIARMHNNSGIVYSRLGNYAEASKNFFAALNNFKEIQDKFGMADAYNNIGIVNREQGNYAEALKYYIASLKIREEMGVKGRVASSYSNIGNIYEIQKNYTKALDHYFAALKIKEEFASWDRINIASIYSNIGNIYQMQKNYPEALKNYLTSLNICVDIGDRKCIASSYNSIGNIYEKQGNFSEALENYFASLKIGKEIQDKSGIVISCRDIGVVYQKQGRYQDARNYLNDVLFLSKEIGAKEHIASTFLYLSKLDSAEANFAQALEHYKMHILYKDSLFNEGSDKRLAQMQVQYESEKKDREIELLSKDNEIKALQMKQQEASLLASRLEAEERENELLQLNRDMLRQELVLAETQKDRDQQQAKADLSNKDRALAVEQLEKQKILRNAMIVGTTLLLLMGLLSYRSLRLRKKIEKQQAILEERKRISADLHDDVGSGLSRIMLLSELVKQEAKMPETRKDAEKISRISQELSSNISEIIWALNANNDYVENTVAYIRRYASEYFEDSPVKLRVITPDKIPDIPIKTENRRNVFYTVKEALHNIIKHAQATEAEIQFKVDNGELSVVIRDNGIGMPEGDLNRFGNGLKNMLHRMTSINGGMNIENGQGTKITLTMPV